MQWAWSINVRRPHQKRLNPPYIGIYKISEITAFKQELKKKWVHISKLTQEMQLARFLYCPETPSKGTSPFSLCGFIEFQELDELQ